MDPDEENERELVAFALRMHDDIPEPSADELAAMGVELAARVLANRVLWAVDFLVEAWRGGQVRTETLRGVVEDMFRALAAVTPADASALVREAARLVHEDTAALRAELGLDDLGRESREVSERPPPPGPEPS